MSNPVATTEEAPNFASDLSKSLLENTLITQYLDDKVSCLCSLASVFLKRH